MRDRIIVISRNGKSTIITGWRAWLLGIAAIVAAWLLMALVVFVWAGVAVTLGLAFVLVFPALIVAALFWTCLSRKPR
ncbi:MAG: hypothetical protein LCH61_01280 [Proteobacteria bacterium]|nr:hypothetical protein [Pseudomonadota bacterium]MCA0421949.1 hypothetical protein [Pseudomonadota bacterium]